MNDQQIIQQLKSGEQVKAFTSLYKAFPMVKSHIRKNNGSSVEAEDIFQEALFILLKKIQEPNFELSSSLSTYVFGISKFLWNNQLRKKKPGYSPVLDMVDDELDFEFEELNNEKINFAQKALASISEKCKEILHFFYIEKYSMKTIAEKFGYTSEQNAKTQKYKCLEKARQEFEQMSNPIHAIKQ